MIVNDFLNAIRNAMYGDSITWPGWIGIGTGITAAAASDTALQTEVYPDGANRSMIDYKTKPSSKNVRYQMNVAAGEANGNTLTEVGALNAATGGTLMNRFVHTGIAKTASFELIYQIVTKLSDV
jgi:hypothetical protein